MSEESDNRPEWAASIEMKTVFNQNEIEQILSGPAIPADFQMRTIVRMQDEGVKHALLALGYVKVDQGLPSRIDGCDTVKQWCDRFAVPALPVGGAEVIPRSLVERTLYQMQYSLYEKERELRQAQDSDAE